MYVLFIRRFLEMAQAHMLRSSASSSPSAIATACCCFSSPYSKSSIHRLSSPPITFCPFPPPPLQPSLPSFYTFNPRASRGGGGGGGHRCAARGVSDFIVTSASAASHLLQGPYFTEMARVLGTFIPVGLAVVVSHELKLGFQKEILLAISRSSIQLLGLGFALKFAFEGEKLLTCGFAIFFMV